MQKHATENPRFTDCRLRFLFRCQKKAARRMYLRPEAEISRAKDSRNNLEGNETAAVLENGRAMHEVICFESNILAA